MQKLLPALKEFYATHKRDLPWRGTRDPYKILVSEIMLQQTQAGRVVPFYIKFIKKFPTARSLAKAPLPRVLREWQGLGYNRRARYLREAAKILAKEGFTGRRLPGVGVYTAGAIAAFAFNKPEVFIETNIRTVFTHFYFPKRKKVSDTELLPLIQKELKHSKMQPRDFYAALMDYGSYLKAGGVRLNKKSAHYVKQSKFEGSTRQLRGAILRELLNSPATLPQLTKNLSRNEEEVLRELTRLKNERLVILRGGEFAIAS